MAVLDRIENKEAIEAAKAEILAALTTEGHVISGCVKSVQCGEINYKASDGAHWQYINITPVDVSKSCLLFRYERNYPSNFEYRATLESERIVFYSSLSMEFRFYWQVIEFY